MKNSLENYAVLSPPTLVECSPEDKGVDAGEIDAGELEGSAIDSPRGNTDSPRGNTGSLEREIDLEGVEQDRKLIARCLAGDVKAWEDLYCRCHPALLSSIKILLGQGNSDANLVDEIAARVWYALVAEDGRLLARYDAERGCRLITFLAAIAKSQAKVLFRAERRRRIREQAASRSESDRQNRGKEPSYSTVDELLSSATMCEFLETLTPSEKGFLASSLEKAQPKGECPPPQGRSVRQLRHRVREKLRKFLSERC
ncbi:MAG: hypothetical protein HQ567_03090 [Candidatus Nealsonbacteria bacterium]|nr:hypothetical protein [Candidatus Nealsonbacteria bacterium]